MKVWLVKNNEKYNIISIQTHDQHHIKALHLINFYLSQRDEENCTLVNNVPVKIVSLICPGDL